MSYTIKQIVDEKIVVWVRKREEACKLFKKAFDEELIISDHNTWYPDIRKEGSEVYMSMEDKHIAYQGGIANYFITHHGASKCIKFNEVNFNDEINSFPIY